MMILNKVMAIAVVLTATSGTAVTAMPIEFTLADSASGSAFPPQIQVSSSDEFIQNGDFNLRPNIGASFPGSSALRTLGDATEEWSRWSLQFDSSPAYEPLRNAVPSNVDLTSAMLTLSVRTGGDTPGDDQLGIGSAGNAHPFGFAQQFSSYTRTFDLLSLFDEADLIQDIVTTGNLSLRVGNDTLVHEASIVVTGTTIPEPSALTCVVCTVVLLAGFRLQAPRVRA